MRCTFRRVERRPTPVMARLVGRVSTVIWWHGLGCRGPRGPGLGRRPRGV